LARVVLSPLQGFFFPDTSDEAIIPDYEALFCPPTSVEALHGHRVALAAPVAWSGITASTPVGDLVVYRVNRLNELMLNVAPHLEGAMPGIRRLLQLYIDSHLPLACFLVWGSSAAGSPEPPHLELQPCFESVKAFGGDVVRAFLFTHQPSAHRSRGAAASAARRSKPLWELVRRILPRGIFFETAPEKKPHAFKSFSLELQEALSLASSATASASAATEAAINHQVLHQLVLCSLFGNYPPITSNVESVVDRGASAEEHLHRPSPSWETRLNLYRRYKDDVDTLNVSWLKRCDFILVYSMREFVSYMLLDDVATRDALRCDHAPPSSMSRVVHVDGRYQRTMTSLWCSKAGRCRTRARDGPSLWKRRSSCCLALEARSIFSRRMADWERCMRRSRTATIVSLEPAPSL